MPVGTVKWFDMRRGYGFIVDEKGRDVFVHFTEISGDGFRRLRDGEMVEYETFDGPKGLSAQRVRRFVPNGKKQASE